MGVCKIGVPQNGWFIMENPIEMDDLGGKTTIFGTPHIAFSRLRCSIIIDPKRGPPENPQLHRRDVSSQSMARSMAPNHTPKRTKPVEKATKTRDFFFGRATKTLRVRCQVVVVILRMEIYVYIYMIQMVHGFYNKYILA